MQSPPTAGHAVGADCIRDLQSRTVSGAYKGEGDCDCEGEGDCEGDYESDCDSEGEGEQAKSFVSLVNSSLLASASTIA
jgi:hypothetical protein